MALHQAYKAFKEMYPRISSGSPLDPWRWVQGDVEGSQKAGRSIFLPKRCQKTSSAADELKPMYADAKDPQLYKEVGYTLCYLRSLFLFLPHLLFSFLLLSHPIKSHLISPHLISSHLISFHQIKSFVFSSPILSYPILSYPILSYPILSYPIL